MARIMSGVQMRLRAARTRPLIICLLAGFAAIVTTPSRALQVSGDVSGAWASDMSPVVVMGDCRVAQGQTLVIGAGVRTLLAPGASLQVDGSLLVMGVPSQPAVFAAAAPLVGSWRSIVVSPTGEALLTDTVIQGGGAADDTELNGALCLRGGRMVLTDCEVSGSASNGVYVSGGSLYVSGTRFRTNGGARPTDAAIHIAVGDVVLGADGAFNSIEDSPFGVYNENLAPVDARGAWWGSASGPQHASNLPGQGVSVSDDVLFAGFATQNPIPLIGDVNGDGRRDLQDVAALARIAAGIGGSVPMQLETADLLPDGQLDLRDATALARVVLTEGP